MKKIITVLWQIIMLAAMLFTACSATSQNSETPLPSEIVETDITLRSFNKRYYFDDTRGALVYFAKDTHSGLYDLMLAYDDQEKEKVLSFSKIPPLHIVDDGYLYFYSTRRGDPHALSPEIDPNYEMRLERLQEVSSFFGKDSPGNLFRASLETKEIQWLASSAAFLFDPDYIYFMELPIDLDQYGMGRPRGCIVSRNSLCRMDKDGSNPILIRSEVYDPLDYITDKYIYTTKLRLDRTTFEAEALPDSKETNMTNKVSTAEKVFYSQQENDNDPSAFSVYCNDLLTGETVKIAHYPSLQSPAGLELIPLDNGGLIIWQSDSSGREKPQVAKIHFYDQEFNLEKTLYASGRYQITVTKDRVFYLLQEINEGKSISDYMSKNAHATLTLCSDDLSMEGENVIRIDVINDSV